MKTKIKLTSEEASEILIALYHRSRQEGVAGSHARELTDLGKRLAEKWEKEFEDWEPGVWKRVSRYPVVVKVELPEDKPGECEGCTQPSEG